MDKISNFLCIGESNTNNLICGKEILEQEHEILDNQASMIDLCEKKKWKFYPTEIERGKAANFGK